MQITEREIFQFPLQLTDTESIRQWRVDIGDLFCHHNAGFFGGIFYFAQAGNTFGQFNHHRAYIFHHRQQHTTYIIDLRIRDIGGIEVLQKADRINIDDTLQQFTDHGAIVSRRFDHRQITRFQQRV